MAEENEGWNILTMAEEMKDGTYKLWQRKLRMEHKLWQRKMKDGAYKLWQRKMKDGTYKLWQRK